MHTPGPWKYMDCPDGTFGVEIPNGHSVWYELEGSCAECFGNMQLIAAAPELLQAINTFIQSVGDDDAHLIRVAIAAHKGVYDAFMELDRAAILAEGKGE